MRWTGLVGLLVGASLAIGTAGCGDDAQEAITCNDLFGDVPGYIFCYREPLICAFYWKSDTVDSQGGVVEESCDTICALADATCERASSEAEENSCNVDPNVTLECNEVASDAICECMITVSE